MAEIKLKIASVVIGSGDGGGSGVAPYYADLPDKPSINGETLSGDMTSEDLGLASSEQSVPAGGTTGQVLAKKSNADNDVQWVNQESGEQGTTDYADLENKPKINNVTLSGNKTTSQLGLQAELVSGTNIKTINNQSIVGSGNITIEGGGTDDYADLDNKPQINSVTLSGNKSASELGLATAAQGALAASAYQKPQTGIPSTDLASGVQTSLGKANTAVQQVTVGTTTTGNAGEPASVVNSGTSTAPVLDFTIPRGADAVNSFKGWFNSLAKLKAAYTAHNGDYAYVVNNGGATIYAYDENYSSDNYWKDTSIQVSVTDIENVFPFGAKVALVSMLQHMPFLDEIGVQYYNTLSRILMNREVLSIVAVYSSTKTIGTNTPLDDLKDGLIVTATYTDGTTSILGGDEYVLSGTLVRGTSTITVAYLDKTTTFNVTDVVLYCLEGGDFGIYGLSTSYEPILSGDFPYTDTSNNRISNKDFLFLEHSKNYSVVAQSSDSTALMSTIVYNDTAMSAVAAHNDIDMSDVRLPGWLALSQTITLSSNESAIRVNFKKADNSAISSVFINSIVIDEIE